LWVQFPPRTSIFCNNDRKNSLLHFLFYGACEHRKYIKMSNWSTEKTKRAPRTKSIQAPKKTQSEITTSESAVKKQEEFEEMKKKTRNMMFGLAAVFVLAVAGMAAYKAMH